MRGLSPPTRDQHAKQERDSQGLKGRLPGHIVEVVSKTLHNRLKTFGRGLQVIGHVPDGLGSSPNTRLIACSGVRTDLVRHERFSGLDKEQQIPTELGSERRQTRRYHEIEPWPVRPAGQLQRWAIRLGATAPRRAPRNEQD